MKDVPIPRRNILRIQCGAGQIAEQTDKYVERNLFPSCDVKNSFNTALHTQNVCSDHVIDKNKVPGLLSITENDRGFVVQHAGDKLGNYCSIFGMGILTVTKHIEITQAESGQTIQRRKNAAIVFTGNFCYCIGGEWGREHILSFG